MRWSEAAASSGTASVSSCAGRQMGAATSQASALAASDGTRKVLVLRGSAAAGPGAGSKAGLSAFATIFRT
ncbi:hypothetical protein [Teichococcus aestuarii]|uniref:Uncharacterized protein n=1 Tax=Teichococcus aestuarii TaxID=568898 RepID=A0A2U1V037_9PROT|nr:hypothetical protein [Pseudoroseomonas aestuarii]PWC27259.1 hypothetical protein CR165_18430 [Pseudoroseomonas aestuarii]